MRAEAASPSEIPEEPTVAPAGAKCAAATVSLPLLVATVKEGMSTGCCLASRAAKVTETLRVNVPWMRDMFVDWPWYCRVSPSTFGGAGVSSGEQSSKTSSSCETSPTGRDPPGGSQRTDCASAGAPAARSAERMRTGWGRRRMGVTNSCRC